MNYGFGDGWQFKARDSRYVGVGLAYDNGPISVGFGYDRQNNVTPRLLLHSSLRTAARPEHLTVGWLLKDFGVAEAASGYKETGTKTSPVLTLSAKLKTFGLGVTAPVGRWRSARFVQPPPNMTGLGAPSRLINSAWAMSSNMSGVPLCTAHTPTSRTRTTAMGLELNGAMMVLA